ncbi:MAG: hypothetical protein GX846_01920, partial [Deltaproteobacteria bacterium]|nr:hypothetical protein [Deltaproteobacteria bacterium]
VPKWLKKVFSIYLIYSLVILAIVFGYVSVYHDDSPRKTGSLLTAPVTVQDLTSEGTDTHSTRGAGAYEPENGSAVRHPIIIEKKKEPAVIKPSAPESKTDVKAPEGSFVAAQGITEKSDVIGTGDIEKEIEGFLMKWKDAWEESAGKDGDISPYLSHYSDEFRSGKFDKKGWASDKSKKNRAKKWIRIGLSEIRVSELVSGNEVKVRFRQEYRSSNFSVKSGKIMQLKKVDGRWLIISEKSG